jgi:hypothetical protein
MHALQLVIFAALGLVVFLFFPVVQYELRRPSVHHFRYTHQICYLNAPFKFQVAKVIDHEVRYYQVPILTHVKTTADFDYFAGHQYFSTMRIELIQYLYVCA